MNALLPAFSGKAALHYESKMCDLAIQLTKDMATIFRFARNNQNFEYSQFELSQVHCTLILNTSHITDVNHVQ